MENEKDGFSKYLKELNRPEKSYSNVASLVINANPFTNGHLYLVEKAARENDLVHLLSLVMTSLSLIIRLEETLLLNLPSIWKM